MFFQSGEGGAGGQPPVHLENSHSTAAVAAAGPPAHRTASRVEGGATSGPPRGAGGRHPRRHTSYHNPIPSAWHTPPPAENQLSYGERKFGGWRDEWRDADVAQTHGNQRGNRRSDIGPDSTDSSYHMADSSFHLGMGFGLDALRKKRRTSSPARSRNNSTAMDTYDDVDGTPMPSQTFSNDVTASASSRGASGKPVSSNSQRHRRSNSSEGLLDASAGVKLESGGGVTNSSMPSSPSASHLTYRGVRSMKHGKSDKAYQEGLRKASSLTDLPGTTSREEPALPRSRSRESLPDDPASLPVHQHRARPVSQVSNFASFSNKPEHHHHLPRRDHRPNLDHFNPNAPATREEDNIAKPKTFFETLRDSFLDPQPPKPRNYRYLKLAGIPQTKPIENYGTDASVSHKPARTFNTPEPSQVSMSATNYGVVSTDNHCDRINRTYHGRGGVEDGACDEHRNQVEFSWRKAAPFSSAVASANHSNPRGVTNDVSAPAGLRRNAKEDSGSMSATTNHHNNHNSSDHQRSDLPRDCDRDMLHATLTARGEAGLSGSSMRDRTLRYIGTSVGVSGKVQAARRRERFEAPPPVTVPSFAWEPKKTTESRGRSKGGTALNGAVDSSSRSVSARHEAKSRAVGGCGRGFASSSIAAPSVAFDHALQERRIVRSVSGPSVAAAASSDGSVVAPAPAPALSSAREWRKSAPPTDRAAPPPTTDAAGSGGGDGSSAGSTDSYEDYFCRSPSPNSFELNGKNKNETDEHKVRHVSTLERR